MRVTVAALVISTVAGHGLMNYPPNRAQNSMDKAGWCSGDDPSKVPQSGTCLWFNQGCTIGCPECTGGNCIGTSCCKTSMAPTLDPKYRTYMDQPVIGDFTAHNPWRAPGFAPILSPCGLAGGWNKTGAPGNGGVPPKGIKQGRDGRSMDAYPGAKVAWPAGSQQEVSWSINANHGGGYAYRLCPKSGKNDEPEECFQRHHLKFVSENQWIQYGNTSIPHGKANRTAIKAAIVSEGTNPKGSTWMRNPIPPCTGLAGGAEMQPGCETPMFTPPMDAPDGPIHGPWPHTGKGRTQRGLYGFGLGRCSSGLPTDSCDTEEYIFWATRMNFNIIDLVEVPKDLTPGDYVLSFRWDCEQTPQIWANCADVTITAPEVMV